MIPGRSTLSLPPSLVLLLASAGACGSGDGKAAPQDTAAERSDTDTVGDADRDGGPDTPVDSVARQVRPAVLDDWPRIVVGQESRGFSSFDRAGGNDDGFNGTYSTLYRTSMGEHVIVDVVGRGRLNTFWFTSGESGHARLDLGKVRIYLDDEVVPRAEAEANHLFSGRAAGFPSDLVFNNARSTGGFVSWVRMHFRSRIRITTEKAPFFYNAQYETFPLGTATVSWRPEEEDVDWRRLFASATTDWASETGSLREVPLDHRQQGSGVIDGLVFEPAGPVTMATLRTARIELTWDDETTPAVSVPLGLFFGSGLGEARVRTVAFRMEPNRYENRFPMPFWKGFHVRVTGVDGRLSQRISPQRYDAADAGHFRAAYRETRPTASSDDFEYLTYEGSGKLVGTVLTVEVPRPAADKGWWEGDLRSYADGRRTPGIHGTGHEDEHFGGWSDEFLDGPFSLPMHGEPKTEILDRGGQYNGNATMYRLWPGISFLRSISHSVEHGDQNNRFVNYSAATFFYAQPSVRMRETDAFGICDDAARAAHGYTPWQENPRATERSAFEGRYVGVAQTLCHSSHRGPATFRLQVTAQNDGVYIRRTFDQQAGRQEARVSIDGAPVGTWYVAEGNPVNRWAERDFFVPGRFTARKDHVTVTITPSDGSPAWDAVEYRALAVIPPR